ncbi:general secretion pathway protein J [Methylosinus sp. sav-2]|uniref:PulJ/GspJ family protein n=1 Tax=unclassified Methylosinus TaxID=2624500 RepID=UPI000466CD59|nr:MULTISPECIES: prepilin-type N-terminal cleavage/methylation domain-containing protein [unclassified Methylosinus]TDX60037.1 general secretion pathway protein J [Methylosinus sp. sav-2]
MRSRAGTGRRAGFTLVETLAALAVASSIIVGAAALTHHVAAHFDHGARGVNEAERFALAMERLSRDFGAASHVALKPSGAIAPAPASAPGKKPEEQPARVAFDGDGQSVVFVTASAIGAQAALEEIVTLSIERAGESARLIRRRRPWLGSRAGLDGGQPRDEVVLLEGRFDISFAYARVEKGVASWRDIWRGESELPRLFRLDLRDPETGERLSPGAEFLLRADAPAGCASAKAQCLPAAKKAPQSPAPRRAPT